MGKKKNKENWYNTLTEAERKIWYLIYYHPTFVRNRAIALDLLFCVIGTGLEWEKGQIVDKGEDNYLTAQKQDMYNLDHELYKKAYTNTFWKDGAMWGDELKASDIRRMKEYNYQMSCIAEYTLKNIEKAVTVSVPPKSFYPLGRHSNLMEIPKNVRADWLELAIETCDLILVTDPLYRGSDNRLRNKNNIRLAKKQRAKLLRWQAQRNNG